MNKSHKSIWNESLGTYVAAAETANATGRKTSSGRKARRVPLRAHAGKLALEQRIVFDAALPATLVEAQAESAAGADPVLAELDQLEAEDAEVDAAAVQAAVETTEPVSDVPEAAAAVDEDEAETGEAVAVAETGSGAAIDESLEAPVAEEPLDGVTETEMAEAAAPERTEIIFVDSIAEGVTEYLDTHPGEVYVLDLDRDGVEQIAEILRDREGVDAIHIVSHGTDGQLFLGSGTLNTGTLANAYGDEMDVIAAALSDDADILIYGCDVASTEAGVELMQGLSDATGADVAASTDATGAAELGGDWVLEAQAGQIDTDALDIAAWQGLLGTSISITGANVTNTGLGFTTVAYNRDGSVGTVAVRTGTPPGFGVAATQLSGDPAEIGEQGGQAERLEITFAGTVTSANVWLAWQNPSESALVNFYQGTTLVGSWSRTGGTDTIDGPFTMTATGGVPFDRMVFTVPTSNAFAEDDYLVNRVDFVLMRPPVAQDNSYTVGEDAGAAVIGNALSDNTGAGVDSDPDGDTLVVTAQTGVSGSNGGVFSVNAAGVVTFDPNGDFEDLAVGESATTTLSYQISDGEGGFDTATITVTVNGANDVPEVVPGNQIPDQNDNDNEVITPINVTGAFTDVDTDVLTYTATGLPAGLTLNPSTGLISGTLDNSASQGGPGGNGVYSVTVTANDGNGGTVSDTFTYTVGNPVPVATDNDYTVGRDDAAAVIGNALSDNTGAGVDSDPDGDTLVVTAQTGVSGSNGGVFSIDAAGVVTFDPNGAFADLNPGDSRDTTLTYTISDGEGGTDTATITVTVMGANDPPVATDNDYAVSEDAGAAVIGNALTDNTGDGVDSDPNAQVLSVTPQSGVSGSAGGVFSIDAAGVITFDPNGEFEDLAVGESTTTSFEYEISDGFGGTDTATITVTVNGANDVPEVVPGNQIPDQNDNDNEVITPINVTGAFTDVDTDVLTYTATGLPAGLTLNPSTGVISGTLDNSASQGGPGSDGVYSVTVTANDGNGGTVSDTFTYTVGNPVPVAQDNSYTVGEDAGAAVIGNALSDNTGAGVDSDPDGDTLVVTAQTGVSGSNGGVFSVNAAGVVTFDPNGDFEDLAVGESATTTLSYQISDGEGGFDTATITVTVNGANDVPEVVPGNQIPDQNDNDNEVITPINVTGAFTDVDNTDALTYTATGLPAGLTLNPSTGVISGTLDNSASQGGPGSDGVYSVTVTANDGNGGTVSDTFTYTVGNPVPVAQDNSYTVGEDAGAAVIGNALSDNTGAGVDSDPDGDTLVVTAQTGVSGSNGGVFSVNAAGVVTFDPNGDFEDLAVGESATTTLSYQISDGEGGFDTATITVTVNGANDAPVATDDGPMPTRADTPATGNVLPNDSDIDGDTLTVTGFTVAGDPTTYLAGEAASIVGVGTLVINGDGGFTFTPVPGYAGPVPSATYTISDGFATDTAVLSFAEVPVVPPAPEPGPSPTPAPVPPAPAPAPAPSVPDAPVWESPAGPVSPSTPMASAPGSALHVLYAVSEASNERGMFTSSLGSAGLDAGLMGEAMSQRPDSLMFDSSTWVDQVGLIKELSPGEVQVVAPALHVQHAVRHQPIVMEQGLFVQHAVRASQLESRLRNAIVDAHNSATAGYGSLLDPFALGTSKPDGTAASVAEAEPQPARPQQATARGESEAAPQAAKAVDDAPVQKAVELPRAAQGFRAQVERMAKDRLHGSRPITRSTTVKS